MSLCYLLVEKNFSEKPSSRRAFEGQPFEIKQEQLGPCAKSLWNLNTVPQSFILMSKVELEGQADTSPVFLFFLTSCASHGGLCVMSDVGG